MLTISKIYRIVDDKNDTRITIEKDGGIYRWDELGFILTELNMSDIFQAIKDMTNFV